MKKNLRYLSHSLTRGTMRFSAEKNLCLKVKNHKGNTYPSKKGTFNSTAALNLKHSSFILFVVVLS